MSVQLSGYFENGWLEGYGKRKLIEGSKIEGAFRKSVM
jgi:hypothetical protein